MFENLQERAIPLYDNQMLLAATFMDPRYRTLKFIKDQKERDEAKSKAYAYIKSVYRNIWSV